MQHQISYQNFHDEEGNLASFSIYIYIYILNDSKDLFMNFRENPVHF